MYFIFLINEIERNFFFFFKKKKEKKKKERSVLGVCTKTLLLDKGTMKS
jgi:hypothetical protein